LVEKKGLYHPLYTIDTVYLSNTNLTEYEAAILLQHGIDILLGKVKNKNESELKISRKSLSASDVNDYVLQKRNLPVLEAPFYKKGIYKTFDEFVQNQPSITDFTKGKNGKVTDEMYVKDAAGSEYLLRDFWGFSDGRNIYINTGDNFFRLTKQDGAFVFYGFNSLMKKVYIRWERLPLAATSATGLVNGSLATQDTHYKGTKKPLEVDMETGESY